MKKKLLLMIGIIGIFSLLGGISYAYFNYYKEGKNYKLVGADLYLKLLNGTDSVNLACVFPETVEAARSHEEDDNCVNFSIEGKNTTSDNIYYEILFTYGDEVAGKTRFHDEDLVFDLIEIENDVETYIFKAVSFKDINNRKIWIGMVNGNTNNTITKNYKLRMWLSEKVIVSDSEPNANYTASDYKNHYASVKVAVRALITDKEYVKVTFDADGGEVAPPYKYVVMGEEYGELPTPERAGYTFVGWNGKNMFKLEERVIKDNIPMYDNSIIMNFDGNGIYAGFHRNNYYGSWDAVNYYQIDLENNRISVRTTNSEYGLGFDISVLPQTKYTINYGETSGTTLVSTGFYNNSGQWISGNYTYSYPRTLTTGNNTYWMMLICPSANNEISTYRNIQVELGNKATAYEPYYVTSDVEVTKWNTSMVLTAKWKFESEWSNYRYNDELQEVSIVSGQSNDGYIKLDGANDYVSIGDINNLSTVSMQVTTKINALSDGSSTRSIFLNQESGGVGFSLSTENKICFAVYLDGYNGYIKLFSTNTADTTSIHDYAGVYDGETMKLYIDGVLDSTLDVSNIISSNNLTGAIKNPNNNTLMMIGCNPDGNVCTGNYFSGDIYSARIYDYAISEDKIRSNIRNDGFLS